MTKEYLSRFIGYYCGKGLNWLHPQDRIILIRKEWYLPNKVIKFNTSYSGYNSTPSRQYEEALTKVKGYFDGK